MTVNTINGSAPRPAYGGGHAPRADAEAGKAGAAQAGRGDRLQLSPQSQRLQQLEATMADEPTPEGQQIERLRAAVSAGEYRVDARQVAAKLLDLESLLGG